jgi:exosome complex RNA-binding protein Rrp42 (RNase PH superfamily)
MHIETIKTYSVQMMPVGKEPMLEVGVRVDGRDLPETRSVYIANIFIDRAMHSLSSLFGMDSDEVERIREELNAGRSVNVELQALPIQLRQAGFLPG